MRRVLCAWLPAWPLQRIRNIQLERSDRPILLYEDVRGRRLVTNCCHRAARRGVASGIPLAEAIGLMDRPSEHSTEQTPYIAPYDFRADCAALEKIACWCQQFSPIVGIEAPDSLMLNITGCAHLFGGEHGLAKRIAQHFERIRYAVRVSIADTVGVAWAIAHFDTKRDIIRIVPSGQHSRAIGSLPIQALRLSQKVVQTLHELDIWRIEQLQSLPRDALPSRFGADVIRRLDQTLGKIQELIVPEPHVDPLTAEWSFEHPTHHRKTIVTVLERLVERLVRKLERRQEGISRLQIVLSSSGVGQVSNLPAARGFWQVGNVGNLPHVKETNFSVGLVYPSLSMSHLIELVMTRLEQVRFAAEISKLRVDATVTAPLACPQEELFESGVERKRAKDLTQLVDRLSTRLGEKAVLRPRLLPDAQPEYACQFEPLIGGKQNCRTDCQSVRRSARPFAASHSRDGLAIRPTQALSRPFFLKPNPIAVDVMSVVPEGPPIRFHWDGCDYVVARCWGPERIETGWWRGERACRDYYRVETKNGQQFWLFRRHEHENWFLHGVFD